MEGALRCDLHAWSFVLGTMIPKSGVEFAYFFEAFGGPGAFLFSFTPVTRLRPSQLAIIALAFGQYVAEPFFSVVHESGFRATRPECVRNAACFFQFFFVLQAILSQNAKQERKFV